MEPEHKHYIQTVLVQYQKGRISLARAAEMAGVDQERFKELLRKADIDRYIEPPEGNFDDEVEQLMRLRRANL